MEYVSGPLLAENPDLTTRYDIATLGSGQRYMFG